MFEEIKSPDFKICPVCKGQLAVGLGGYYKHVTPSNRCGYYEKTTDDVFAAAIRSQAEKKSQEQ